jgi:DNA (cytosine-5)-methyltransferase 1
VHDLRFVDLFAGIGGFHQALGPQGLGMRCVFASEIDRDAADVYEWNHGTRPAGDIKPLTEGAVMAVPEHDVLTAGFPCQPFSKSGFQRGFNETRGTLFFNICRILEARRPRFVMLENVRNLAGPRQRETWETIVRSLREFGYSVSSSPAVFSPHLLPPNMNGSPQIRERVFILAEYVGRAAALIERPPPLLRPVAVEGWTPTSWNLTVDLPLEPDADLDLERYGLRTHEKVWIDTWNELIGVLDEERLPSFPIWIDAFTDHLHVPAGTPAWKRTFLVRNHELYMRNKRTIDSWLDRHNGLKGFPASRRKLEWQAQDADRDLWKHVMHLRPSGIRVKQATYLPALVAITQTSIIGPQRRRLMPREAARLQGLPDSFVLHPNDKLAYRQLGNGVNVGVVQHAWRSLHAASAARGALAAAV